MPDNKGNIIDSLSIELVGQAKKAIDSLAEVNGQLLLLQSSIKKVGNTKINASFISDATIGRLGKLKDTMSGFDDSSMKSFIESVESLGSIDSGGLAELSSAAKGLSVFRNVNNLNAENLGKFIDALGDADTGRISDLAEAAKGLSQFSSFARMSKEDSGANLASSLREIESIDPGTISEIATAAKGLSAFSSLARLSANGDGLDKTVSALKSLSTVDFSNLSYLAETAKELRMLYEQYNLLYKSAEKLAKAQNNVKISIKATAKEATRANTTFHKSTNIISKFLSSIKRIVMYRIIRNALRSITQGFSEGIQNLYHWSQAVGTSFAPAMDRLATASLYLKNGFASMWSPLIERAIPALDAVIDKFVEFFNFVQEGFAQLTGQATWNKALKYPVSYADALDDASASAKEFKNQLMGFDELNVINTPTNSSRGKGADAKDYSAMFELVETAAGNNLASLGDRLADALAKPFEDPDKWSGYGETAADLLSTAFDNAIDFFQRGHENGMFANMGRSFSNFISRFATKMAKKITDTNWNEVIDAFTTALCDIIEGIDIGEVLKSLAKLIVSIVFSIPSMVLASLRSVVKITSSYIRMWAGAFSENSFFGALLNFASDGLDQAADWLDKKANKWDALGDAATKAVWNAMDGYGLTTDTITSLGGSTAARGGSKNGIELPITPTIEESEPDTKTWWSDFNTSWDQNRQDKKPLVKINLTPVTNPIREWWSEFTQKWGIRYAIVKTIVQNIPSAIAQGFTEFKNWWGTKKAEVWTTVQNSWQDVKTGFDNFKKIWGNKSADVYTKVSTLWSAIQSGWENLTKQWSLKGNLTVGVTISNILAAVENGWNTLVALWQGKGSLSTSTNVNAGKKEKGGFFASGGYPSSGTLFWAGENHVPEILGTVGGQNAVAGGAEITGIRDEIARQGVAEQQLLVQVINAISNMDLTLVANSNTGRWVSKALKAYQGVTG